ncbi:MAG: (2Fe-2S)-binding protein [Gammaproteobacteria bacterium]|nr:(2Fe-2S)-binding protein [Gammaproteobacteria bacterium]
MTTTNAAPAAAPGEQARVLTLRVNGIEQRGIAGPGTTLLEFLREELGLTGSKRGCDLGECGCCSVLVDGRPMLSCLLLAADVAGSEITTIEGIARGETLHPLQQAMVDEGAIQCGFCTPAMVINGVDLFNRTASPSRDEIKACVSATVCRCTGYNRIEQAFVTTAERLSGKGGAR